MQIAESWLLHVSAFILIGLTISAVGVNALKTTLHARTHNLTLVVVSV